MGTTQKTIDLVHLKVHEGDFYTASHRFEAVADSATVDVLITTGDKALSFGRGGSSSEETVTGSSTKGLPCRITVRVSHRGNNNRTSSNGTDLTMFYGPTVSAAGTELLSSYIPGGAKSKAIGGASEGPAREGSEWILAANTNYLLRTTNTSGGAVDITISVGFYEA